MIVDFNMEALRRALSDARMQSRMSQSGVANLIGCNRKWVSRFERGLSIPSFDIVLAYAALFGVGIYMDNPRREADLSKPSRDNSEVERLIGSQKTS